MPAGKGWSFSDKSVEHLGRRLGTRNSLDDVWAQNEVESAYRVFDFLKRDVVSKQIRYLLLKNVVVSRVAYVMRTTSPEMLAPLLFKFDQHALETFCSIFEIDSSAISPHVITQIGLPVSKAGFGLFPTRDLADSAFVASVLPLIDRASPSSDSNDILTQFNNAKTRLISMGVSLPDDPSRVHKLQRQFLNRSMRTIFVTSCLKQTL